MKVAMEKRERIDLAAQIMMEFAAGTGLSDDRHPPRRYLWTDAFAVCNFLELYHGSQDEKWLALAKKLVSQVHHVLGRHRPDATQKGWLSGLSDEEGERHPTRGGLRIGKRMKEREPDEPMDERLEWERDGQYYHYLTKWMHALHCMSRVTEDGTYLRWGMELAQAAHAAFCHPTTQGAALYWKMSTNLSRPLVPSVGQHDPLDGFITCSALQSSAISFAGNSFPDLRREIEELGAMCRDRDLGTDDALGIGGILCALNWAEQLMVKGNWKDIRLFQRMVDGGLASLQDLGTGFLDLPSRYRLAFRELGLSIGLRGTARFARLVDEYPEVHGPELLSWLQPRLEDLTWSLTMAEQIERYWLEERKKDTENWKGHGDINMVMLATSLAPEQFLRVD